MSVPPTAPAPAAARTRSGQNADGYTAIVHFHGMGSQRRFEESCRLIDSLSEYLRNAYRDRQQSLGRLVGITAAQETHRIDDKEIVTYIKARHVKGAEQPTGGGEIRVYECYWAPAMAGTKSAVAITKWMLSQAFRPIYSMITPWWERQQLRESMLLELRQRRETWPAGTEEGDFDALLDAYKRFRHAGGAQGGGYFRHFQKMLAMDLSLPEGRTEAISALADRWWWFAARTELRNAFLLITLLLVLALSLGGLIWSIFRLLVLLAAAAEGGGVLATISDMLGAQPTFNAAASLAISLLSLIGVSRFLTDSMGDVQAWATYVETDLAFGKRASVLKMGFDIMQHVLMDPKCGRVVVTSHSLGTSVAFDTFPVLALYNNAYNAENPIEGPIPLEKVSHFVTMGSPIDKIHYFFGNQRSTVISFLDVLDQMRMTTARMPFAKNRKPHIHWTNYWDDADPISGPLQSPVEPGPFVQGVDDVHVENFGFPAPAKSHNAYFRNRTVIDGIFRMAVLNDLNYATLPLREDGHGYDYASVMRGPGAKPGRRIGWVLAAFAVPWLALVALIAWALGATVLTWILGVGTALLGAVLVVFWRLSLLKGNREPL